MDSTPCINWWRAIGAAMNEEKQQNKITQEITMAFGNIIHRKRFAVIMGALGSEVMLGWFLS